jgi:hypothetical protein
MADACEPKGDQPLARAPAEGGEASSLSQRERLEHSRVNVHALRGVGPEHLDAAEDLDKLRVVNRALLQHYHADEHVPPVLSQAPLAAERAPYGRAPAIAFSYRYLTEEFAITHLLASTLKNDSPRNGRRHGRFLTVDSRIY